jgi:hypothetical protein
VILVADEHQVLALQLEPDLAALAGPQADALEALQLAHRPGAAGHAVADIELDHVFAMDLAGVGDLGGDALGLAPRQPRLDSFRSLSAKLV